MAWAAATSTTVRWRWWYAAWPRTRARHPTWSGPPWRAALGVLDRWPGDYRGWVAGAAAAEPDVKLRAEMEKYLV